MEESLSESMVGSERGRSVSGDLVVVPVGTALVRMLQYDLWWEKD